MQEAVKDSLKLLKLYFHQTDKPMIPFMCNDLEKLSKNLLKLFIKPEVIDKCTSPKQLKEIDVRKKRKFAEEKKINKNWVLGRNTTFIVVQERFSYWCRGGCLRKNVVIYWTFNVLDPRDILMISTEEAEKKMKSILNHHINLKQVAPVFSDKVLSQFTDFLTESKVCQDMFIEFNKESDRLDDFYFKKCNINRYKELAVAVKILLTSSHGKHQ